MASAEISDFAIKRDDGEVVTVGEPGERRDRGRSRSERVTISTSADGLQVLSLRRRHNMGATG